MGMGAYVALLVSLAAWTFLALRDRPPLRVYAVMYGVNTLVAITTEWVFAIVLDHYSFGGLTNFFLVTVGIEPLMGLLYAHYSRGWPVMLAVGAAAALGAAVEPVFLWLGAYRYDRGWHPFLTAIFFTGYFLWTRWLTKFITGVFKRHRLKTLV